MIMSGEDLLPQAVTRPKEQQVGSFSTQQQTTTPEPSGRLDPSCTHTDNKSLSSAMEAPLK